MLNPRVSVLLPVFNGSATLGAALDSLARQSFEDFEVVIVDDGSTDGTNEIARDWVERDKRFRLVHHLVNQGLVASLADGLAQVRAELVARLDADDLCLPERLQRQVDEFNADGALTLSWTAYERRGIASGETLGVIVPPVEHGAMQLALTRGNRILHSSVMFRAHSVRAVGGYLSDWYPAEDYDLWCRLLESGVGRGIAEALVVSQVNPDGISFTNSDLQSATAARISRAFRGRLRPGKPAELPDSGLGRARLSRSLARAVRRNLRERGLPTAGVDDTLMSTMLSDLAGWPLTARWAVVAVIAPRAVLQRVRARVASRARR